MVERERTGAEERRLLLGRQTPYVGRDLELELLETQLGICIEESVARGVLVLAPSGMGKSRLRQEFLRRVEERPEAVEILLGRGDPLRGGVATASLDRRSGTGAVSGRREKNSDFVSRPVWGVSWSVERGSRSWSFWGRCAACRWARTRARSCAPPGRNRG